MKCSNQAKDRYCSYKYNPATGEDEREWIQYEDGVFEPVRRTGSVSRKWNDQRTDYKWWQVRKPADWHPSDEGFKFSWNHTLGEANKPSDWGNKSRREQEAGDIPHFMQADMDDDGRIATRTERLDGRRETWDFQYDEEGRLTACLGDTGWCQEFEYDDKGRRSADYEVGREPLMRKFAYGEDNRLLSAGDVTYTHDENGFRTAIQDGEDVTRYAYSPDYRLLGALLPDGREVSYDHDRGGMRVAKSVNGVVVERYQWLDFIRLDGFADGRNTWHFHYHEDERLPHWATINDVECTLHFDQVGSLKAVVTDTGNVVKAIQYGPFGDVLRDSNPGLRAPLGFAGGLSDPDTGFTRFGWRDYDPETGRWTALDPIGDAGGDDDWYGYCLDDPVNMIDPLGLYYGADTYDRDWGGTTNGEDGDPDGGYDDNNSGDSGNRKDDNSGSWVDALKEWAQSLDFRETKGKSKAPSKSYYEQVLDRRRSAKMTAEREAEKEKTVSRYNNYIDQKERARSKARQVSSIMDHFSAQEEKFGAKNEKLGGVDEPLGSPEEPLGGPDEKLGGTERTVALAKGLNVTNPNQKHNQAFKGEPKKEEISKAKAPENHSIISPAFREEHARAKEARTRTGWGADPSKVNLDLRGESSKGMASPTTPSGRKSNHSKGGTRGIGGGLSFDALGFGVGGGAMVSEDEKGNRAFELNFEYGPSTEWGPGAGLTYQETDAELAQLAGLSQKGGGTINVPTPVGIFGAGAQAVKGNGYTGKNYNLSWSPSKGKLPNKPGSANFKQEYALTFPVPPEPIRDYDEDLW